MSYIWGFQGGSPKSEEQNKDKKTSWEDIDKLNMKRAQCEAEKRKDPSCWLDMLREVLH